MLNYFDPAPAPAKGAPLSAEAQAELNARYADQLAAKVAEAENMLEPEKSFRNRFCCIRKLGDKMGVG